MSTNKKPIWQRINKLFLVTVVIPTALSAVYFGFIASGQYISDSSFVIYNPQQTNAGGFSSLLATAGLSHSSSGAYSVHDYILSRDALAELQRTLNYRQMVSNSHIDLFNRFGGILAPYSSFEELFQYYKKMVADNIDTVSNISTLQVTAYTAQEAQRINANLLALGQNLINRLNTQANEDGVRFYKQDVAKAEAKVRAASLAMAAYRNKQGVFNPAPESALQLQLVSKLQDRLINAQTQLAQLMSSTPHNPQVALLRKGIQELEKEIRDQSAKVTGGSNSLASKASPYEQLVLSQTFAEKELAASLAALEQARVTAQKQQLFLEVIAKPSLPDEAMQPKRVRGVLAVFVVGLLLWGVLSVIVGGVREHHDR
ncbi:MAG: capsule biosynthesis protein [Betaproteobacteria bacterium]|nr:capsule biosynthesis protein [Betaproteobacteria bacterium]